MSSDTVVLAVDLDGSLIRSDLLHEAAMKLLRLKPHLLPLLPLRLARGRAQMKRWLAERVQPDVASLPYDSELLAWLHEQKAAGRRLVLCTASDQRYADAVAAHLGLFEAVLASDGQTNLASEHKAAALVARYGKRGFDYLGNSRDDLQVWQQARRAVVVNAGATLRREVAERFEVEREFVPASVGLPDWLHAMRLHQWLKNLLLLLPLAGANHIDHMEVLSAALLAFLSFGLCASSVYVFNDLLDLESDRKHPTKHKRPFASGKLSIPQGLRLAMLLMLGSALLASQAPPGFRFWLLVYFGLTVAYSLHLKRRVIVDCLTLGILYTLRIVAGCAMLGLPASFWLLAFSLFLFISLAFVKRFSELSALAKLGRSETLGRGYLASDLGLVQAMGVAAGFGAVLLLALYIDSSTVARLYREPERLWLAIPVQFYWISRMWMQAQRGHMHDDPVVFALRDRGSLVCAMVFIATLWAAR